MTIRARNPPGFAAILMRDVKVMATAKKKSFAIREPRCIRDHQVA
ncbi:MAG: hypothetical protein WA869_14750 [Alloacidobacterium sp.]